MIAKHGQQAVDGQWRADEWCERFGLTPYRAREIVRLMRADMADKLSPITLDGIGAKLDGYQPRRERLRARNNPPPLSPSASRVDVEPLPEDSDLPIETLIEQRRAAAARKVAGFAKHTRTITLESAPIGLLILGDPHVDNEGCDWSKLLEHVDAVRDVPGIYAACVGDMQDNWIGRLGRLYAHASVTASDGWRLSEWLFDELPWLAVVGGNHDAWSHAPGSDPLHWLTQRCGVPCYAPDEIRITLRWRDRPDLEPVVWLLRHDFKGRSWYHPTHGPNKEAMLDGRVHLLTAGHIHQWGALTTEQRHERVTHALRVRGYKRCDEHAKALGFPEQQHGEAVLVVIDPHATGPGRLTPFWDVQKGADYLTWLRGRA